MDDEGYITLEDGTILGTTENADQEDVVSTVDGDEDNVFDFGGDEDLPDQTVDPGDPLTEEVDNE